MSIATVSRVLNNNARVAAKTRSRVLKVARELGYEPHPSARSLARRKPNLVSAVIPMVTNYFFMEVLRGLQERLGESEYDLLVYTCRTMEEVDAQLDRALHRGRSAGVLLFSSPVNDRRLERIRNYGQPVVLVDCSHPEFDSVSIDNEQGGYAAVRHLLDEGRDRIGLIMGHPDSVPAHDRHRGYRRALKEASLALQDDYVAASDDDQSHGYTEAFGYEAMQRLLQLDPTPDAVFATSDVQALGALSALRDAQLAVPGDVAVVGFDDIRISKHIGLTTLRQPMHDVGCLAAEMLLSRIADPGRAPAHSVFSPSLVVRPSSTGTPPQARSDVSEMPSNLISVANA